MSVDAALRALNPMGPHSVGLSRVNQILGTSSGQDKFFMVYNYAASLVAGALTIGPLGKNPSTIEVAARVSKLQDIVGDARILYRLFGLLPIIEWMQTLRNDAYAPKDRTLRLIETLQAWSMLIYYPLEHWYYLAWRGVLTLSDASLNAVGIWSCRFWALYTALQIWHIRRSLDLNLIAKRSLYSDKKIEDEKARAAAHAQLTQRRRAIINDFFVQCGYLPLTVHWSVDGGILPNKYWVGLAGTLSAVCGLRAAWWQTA